MDGSRGLSLLLSHDPRRLVHPSASLGSESRPLAELAGGSADDRPLPTDTLVQWHRPGAATSSG